MTTVTLLNLQDFPRIYILAPVALTGPMEARRAIHGNAPQHLAAYNLEMTPSDIFDVWFLCLIEAHPDRSAILATIDRRSWTVSQRLYALRDLQERGIEVPLYRSSAEALQTLETKRWLSLTAKEEALRG